MRPPRFVVIGRLSEYPSHPVDSIALLYGVEARDLATFFTVPMVLAVTALLATIAPTRVSPIIAIRSD